MIYHRVLENELILLRAIEPEDIDILYRWENNTDIWDVSSTIAPFSKNILRTYIKNSHLDIYEARQLRLMIVAKNIENQPTIGAIDLYDFDPHNQRAGIGIYIDEHFKSKGYATKALQIISLYCKNVLFLHQLFCEISSHNLASLSLFKNSGFSEIGIKKEWLRTPAGYVDVHSLQLVL